VLPATLVLSTGVGLAAAKDARTGAARAHAQLMQGSRGSGVEALQRALRVPADGIYGPRTVAAVRAFQRREGLAEDGVAGPRTQAALELGSPRAAAVPAATVSPTLERIAACESGGDPTRVSPSGRHRGKYQFSRATWRALGGRGNPAAAREAEQDRRASALLAQRGTAPWPRCGLTPRASVHTPVTQPSRSRPHA
jgi:peptidoglycan hydrolase-like protein with peptidoglycan-binding domain